MPSFDDSVIILTPRQYELAVKDILDGSGLGLEQYTSSHLEAIEAPDGTYIFDVTARFSALGADFLVLIECKHERRKVERQDVQTLHTKLVSTGAQKAMLFSIAGFQSGAMKYAGRTALRLSSSRTATPRGSQKAWAREQRRHLGWTYQNSSAGGATAIG